MVELEALRRAREARLACAASSRRAGWEFRRAVGQLSEVGRWIDGGEKMLRFSSQWAGLGWAAVQLFSGGKGGAGRWAGKLFAGSKLLHLILKAVEGRRP
ncbi:MAG: hypothetical protein EBZ44_03220 [Verrucomicrobia bacterium]|nr:hypothetical protein [bacterium]NDA25588.1 hypothetical protein [Verrucomicrobiota bacterium]NDD56723.1 hypothetical protein [Verrucomicrobiota bacterium]NDD81895.1 hypothetical protein [Verrucomicrobiota bacterium]